MKKPRQPKFIIKVSGYFVNAEIKVFRGHGITELKRIRSIHQKQIVKHVGIQWRDMTRKNWDSIPFSEKYKMTVEIINPLIV